MYFSFWHPRLAPWAALFRRFAAGVRVVNTNQLCLRDGAYGTGLFILDDLPALEAPGYYRASLSGRAF